MLKPVFDYVRQLLAVKRQTENNTSDIEEIRKDDKQMAAAIQRLELRMDRLEENSKRDFENLILRLENALLKSNRGLPPGSDSDA